jgi:hypothetical protein
MEKESNSCSFHQFEFVIENACNRVHDLPIADFLSVDYMKNWFQLAVFLSEDFLSVDYLDEDTDPVGIAVHAGATKHEN